jgi:methyl-accepting chemotaxis protein
MSVKKVSDIVAEIAAASREQSSGIDQVGRAIMQMDELTQQNAALVEEATAASKALAEQSRELNQLMGRYDIGAAAKPSAVARAAAPEAPRTQRPARHAGKTGGTPKSGGAGTAQQGEAEVPLRKAAGDDAEWQEF